MEFRDIFKEEGLYVADTFSKGSAFEIKRNSMTNELELHLVTYNDVDTLFPNRSVITVYEGLFNKDYKKVFTRQSLFN